MNIHRIGMSRSSLTTRRFLDSGSTRARPSTSVTATCTASARRCWTVPPPPGSSTIGPGCCSARTASAPRCRRRSWPDPPTYARWAIRFASFGCCGRRSTAPGCTRSTRQDSAPRSTRSVPWKPPIYSTHLPPVQQPDDRLFETVLLAPQTNPFVGPDQAALEALLATFQPG
jgi:hypothetical protein